MGGSSAGGSGEVQPCAAAEPIDFATERERHLRFVGRADVLARLDEWLLGPDDTRWVVVTGGPGMGKSALLSAWLARREAAGVQVPHHFVRRQVIDWDQPERIAASLAAQTEAMFPEQRDDRAKPEGRLPELLGRVSRHLGASGRLVIVVDGLDETRAEPGDNPLPRFLPHAVPAGIRILCATRPTYPHLGWIEARSPARRVNLDDAQWASSNEAVVRGFWETVALDYEPPLPAATVAAAIARAGGNVLHAVMLHDVLRDLPPDQRRADRIPGGLRHLIGEIWDRAASTPSVRAGLGLLCAAQEALTLDALAEVATWNYDDKQRFVREARQLLFEEPASWAGAAAYRPRHDWVRELMAERLGGAALRAHHDALARTLARWPCTVEPMARRYALRHALIHRAEAGAWADAWRLAADMRFLEAKCRELGAHETEADLARIAERCRASGDEALIRRFGDLARALARESHWLRTAPEATAALVWNRLRQLGWTADEIGEQIQIPEGTKFLRVRHLASRESAALVRDLVGHAEGVTACVVTPDGRRVVSASADRTLKVWDLASGRVEATLAGHAAWVTASAVTPDGRRVVSASADGTLKVWDLASGRVEATMNGHASSVTACAVTPDGRRVVSASDDRTLKVWDLASGRVEAALVGHTATVLACAVTPDGRRVVSASADGTLKVWDLASGRLETTPAGHTSSVTACAVTPDGRRLVSASADKTLQVWDLASRRVEATLAGHTSSVTACAVTPNGRRLVSASYDGTLRVRDLASGYIEATLDGHAAGVTACAVAPDGRRVVSASADRTLKVWDLASGRLEVTLGGHAAGVTACAVTPDGRRVVSASADRTLKVWDLASGYVAATLAGHAAGVTACAVTPDGRRVVSASADRTLKVWDLDVGTCLLTHRASASYVAVATTASAIIAGDAAGAVWFLDMPPPEMSESSAPDDRRPGRPLTSNSEAPAQRQPMTKPAHGETFDVFLSHNSRDKPAVRQLVARVVAHELAVWLDEDQLQPGIPWQPLLELGIRSSRSVAVLVGNDGIGPWENVEMRAALQLAVGDGRPVIPVLLPGSTTPPELPLFLATRTWVDLRNGLTDDGVAKLVWGITGKKPGPAGGQPSSQLHGAAVAAAPPISSPPVEDTPMTRDLLFTRLSQLLSPQFDEVMFRANIPPQYLPAASAPQASRAADALRYMEQQNQLDRLGQIVRQVMTGRGPVGTDPR